MVAAATVLRKLPGALGHVESAVEESFSVALEGRPEYPHYTRPAAYRGWHVPDVPLSGHHEQIRRWREERPVERAALAVRDAAAAAERATGGRASSDRAAAASAPAASGG